MAPTPEANRFAVSPGGRCLAAAVLSAGVALSPATPAALGAAAVVVAAVVVATGARGRLARVLVPATPLLLCLVLPLLLTQGLEHAAAVFARSLLALAALAAPLSALRGPELAPALRGAGVPSVLAATVGSAVRNTAVLREEGRRLLLARNLRGRTGPADGARLVGALLTRAAARAERVDLAMALRGYDPDLATAKARPRARDAWALGLSVAAVALVHAAGRLSG